MSDVQLPIAKDTSDGTILHISDTPYKVLKDKVLVCPFCGGRVYKRAGTRQPHFFHKPKNDCNVSRDTLLHEGAKYFIYDRLVNNIEFKIYVDTSKVESPATKKILNALGISSFCISSKSVFPNNNCQHEVEKSLGSYRPDILSVMKEESQEKLFAWEVFVSHELEDEKVRYFMKDRIGFVELIPQISIDPFDGYIFSLNRFHNIESCFDDEKVFTHFQSTFEERLFELSKDKFEERVVQGIVGRKMIGIEKKIRENIENEHIEQKLQVRSKILKKQITDEISEKIMEETKESICRDIRQFPIGFSTEMTKFLTQRFKTHRYNDFHNYLADGQWVAVKEIELIKNKQYKNIRINSKFNILSNFDCFSNILLFMLTVNFCKPIFHNKETKSGKKLIIGLKLTIPNSIAGKIQHHEIVLNNNYTHCFKDVQIVEFELVNWKAKNNWIVIATALDDDQEYIVSDFEIQLFRLLEFFIKNFHVRFSLGETRNGYKGISEIEIKGLPDESDMKEFIESKLELSHCLPKDGRADRLF